MKEQYKTFNFQKKTKIIIEKANELIAEMAAKGFTLTVRQIYYQFVARRWAPNNIKSYGYIGAALNKGRMAGMIDWWSIEDRTRYLRGNQHWNSPSELLEHAAKTYKINSRGDQNCMVEVWIEKDALVGLIDSVCRELDVDFFACRGYVSLSEMWRAAMRMRYQKTVILYLGDHDPSGLDMTRVAQEQLELFGCEDITVKRIALTMEQVKKYQPPPNPAKLSDSRAADYMREYGTESWELDALTPEVIEELVRKEVGKLTDEKRREKLLEKQQNERDRLQEFADDWEDLEEI